MPTVTQPDPLLCQIRAALEAVLETGGAYSRLSATATLLAAHLLEHYAPRKDFIRSHQGGLPGYKLRRAIAYIHHYLDQNLSLSAIAAEVSAIAP